MPCLLSMLPNHHLFREFIAVCTSSLVPMVNSQHRVTQVRIPSDAMHAILPVAAPFSDQRIFTEKIVAHVNAVEAGPFCVVVNKRNHKRSLQTIRRQPQLHQQAYVIRPSHTGKNNEETGYTPSSLIRAASLNRPFSTASNARWVMASLGTYPSRVTPAANKRPASPSLPASNRSKARSAG